MNQISSKKDFGWYQEASDGRVTKKAVMPTRGVHQSVQSSNPQSGTYRQVHQAVSQAKHTVLQEPTIINIESKVYSAPIKVISVSHSLAHDQARRNYPMHQQQSHVRNQQLPARETSVFENPLYEPRIPTSKFNTQIATTQLPPNDFSKSSILEETEPLLDHGDHYDTKGITEDSYDFQVSDTLVTPDKMEVDNSLNLTTGFSENEKQSLEPIPESPNNNTELDSSLKIMKRNSLQLDSLNFLETDLESGAMFDDNTADLVDLEYKGDATQQWNDSYSDFDERISDSKKWDFYYARRSPAWITEMEEQERLARTARGMDAELLGKWHRVQREFMSSLPTFFNKNTVSEKLSEASEKVSEVISVQKENIKEKVTDLQESMNESFSESAYLIKSGISGVLHSVAETAQGLVGSAKASLGIYPVGSFQSINQLEEKERAFRMHQKIDPVLDAKKRHVERELMSAIKPAC